MASCHPNRSRRRTVRDRGANAVSVRQGSVLLTFDMDVMLLI